MNKTISIISAAILGAIIMTLPLLLVTPSYQEKQTMVAPTGGENLSTDLKEETKATQAYRESETMRPEMGGMVLLNITYVGSIITLGLIIALGVFLYVKKRMLPST